MPDHVSRVGHASRSRSRDRLRYKKRESRKHERRSPSRAKRSKLNQTSTCAYPEVLDEEDEAFYTSMAYDDPPQFRNQEDEFREQLFDALADEEGREYWQEFYEQPLHGYDRPDPEMTDDEYATYVRRAMWNRQHNDQAQARRIKEEEQAKTKHDHEIFVREQEQIKNFKEQAHLKQQMQARWSWYLKSWNQLDGSEWSIDTVPWPTLHGTTTSLTRTSIEAFLICAGEARAVAREELRRRWHPDRFQQRAEKHVVTKDQIQVLANVTTVAQILNEIIAG